MRWGLRQHRSAASPETAGHTVGVVVPAYQVEGYLSAALDSLLAQTHPEWSAIVVDDGSLDATGTVAETYAARDPRIRVHRQANAGLGAARNAGLERVEGEFVGFLDSDDVLPPTALSALVSSAVRSGSDLVAGSLLRCEPPAPAGLGEHEPRWLHRLHNPARVGITIDEHPEILGDVFAPTKLFRREFWDARGLRWPEGVRYEDQPTTTEAFLASRFDVVPDLVYHWKIRTDGTSITQQRGSLTDLRDRWTTKRMALRSVLAHGDEDVTSVFVDRVLPGDLHRYFVTIPNADDEWWQLLVDGVRDLWGERSLVHSGLPPVHRLCGWLVERDRHDDAVALMSWMNHRGSPAPRSQDGLRLEIPADVVDLSTVDEAAISLRDFER